MGDKYHCKGCRTVVDSSTRDFHNHADGIYCTACCIKAYAADLIAQGEDPAVALECAQHHYSDD